MKRLIGFFATSLILAFSIFAGPATAATKTLIDPLDGNANDSNLDGVWDVLFPGPAISLLAYTGPPTYHYRGALEFDLAPLGAAPIVVNQATLRVSYQGASGSPALTLQFYGYAGNGAIELADFQTGASAAIGPRYDAFGPGLGKTYYEVPVAPLLQSLANSHATHAGFMVQNLVGNQTELGGYYSLSPPQLVVNYDVVPEPGTGGLLAVGALLTAAQRRRR